MRAIKTLFMTHAAEFGGAELSLLDILGGLDRSAVEPVFASFSSGPLVEAVAKLGVRIIEIDVPPEIVEAKRADFGLSIASPFRGAQKYIKMLPVALKLEEIIREQKIEVVYTNTSKAHIIGGFAGGRAGASVVWHYRDFPTSAMMRMFYNSMASAHADVVVCNSRFTAEQFESHPSSRVVYSGIPAERVRMSRSVEDARRELGIPADAPVAGMVGRLERWKGAHLFIEAAAKALEKHPGAWFMIVGAATYCDEKYADDLRGMARDAGLAERMIFTGFRRDVYDCIGAMNVYVHPSIDPEPFGRGIVEAMLLGKPVIASGAGGPLEIVMDGLTGVTFYPIEAEKLANAIDLLFRDPETAETMGRKGRERAALRFNLNDTIREVEKIIQTVKK